MSTLRYQCGNCGYVYNPQAYGGMTLDSQDAAWECPECQVQKDQFTRLLPEELQAADNENGVADERSEALKAEQIARNVLVDKRDLSVYELHRQHRKGNLHLQPDFQRYNVWSNKQASQLVESVFLNVPIPMVYLSEEADGRSYVIDGQQRLNSFFRFLDNELRLTGLETLNRLNAKRFKDLDEELQQRLEDYTLRVIVILRDSDPEVKFEVFKRLNTGGTHLNDQELRNCMYRGRFNQFLKEVSACKPFLSIFGIDEPHPRMADMELALRFFAFYDQTYLKYPGSMKRFLNAQMERHTNTSEDVLSNYEEQFKKAVDLSLSIFGDYAFRRFVPGSQDDPNGAWEAGRGQSKFNRALYDVIMYGFTRYPKAAFQSCADAVREELIHLMSHDSAFIDSINLGTSGRKQVTTRFKKWLNAIDEIAGEEPVEPRTFSTALKRQLFDQDSTCRLCGQQIVFLDDAEVHHHKHYWRGGRTIPSNARLVHRYCNRREGGG